MEEEEQVNPAELLELVSGLRDKGPDAEDQPADAEYRKGENCLYFSKALMRTLRREQRAGGYSAMSQLVRWEIPKSDIVPLILSYRRDKALCLSLLKVLVALTLPVTRTFNGVRDHLEKLELCKELFVTSGDLLAVLMGFLAEPLARDERSKEDVSTIDAMLNLFHNLLHIRCVANPMLDDLLVKLFFRVNIMDTLVVVAQSVDSDANRQWALLLTNTFHLLTDGLVPEDVCHSHYASLAMRQTGGAAVAKALEAESTSRLKAIRQREKHYMQEEKFRLSGPRQGGTLITKDADGSLKVQHASELVAPMRTAPKVKPRTKVAAPWDRVDRVTSREAKADLFVFFERLLTDDVFSVMMHEAAATIASSDLDEAFVPSFQADVNRYIRLVAWFVRFDYVRQVQAMRLRDDPSDVRREHPILDAVPKHAAHQTFTLQHIEAVLNPTTVEFLFQRAEHSLSQKPPVYRDVHIIFRAIGEILNTCGYILCNGTMQLRYEAKKTLYRIFLDRKHFLDRLPLLLSKVVLSKMPRHYLVSLVNTVDLTFTVLEKIEEIDKGLVVLKKQKRSATTTADRADEDEGPKLSAAEEERQLQQDLLGQLEIDAPPQQPHAQERFNDFEELQTQDFRLSDYIRRFQHNKVVEICTVLLDECATNTDELNTSIWRLFERIRTGAGDTNAALPAIFCQARVLNIFSRLLAQRDAEGAAMRGTLAELADFGEHIVMELMRLTANGSNAHIFAALLFWRSLRENQDFEDLNMRLAYEDAMMLRPDGSGSDANSADNEPEDGAVLRDDGEILLDPEAIAASLREDERRKREAAAKRARGGAPRKPKTAMQLFVADEKARDGAEMTIAEFKPIGKERWLAASDVVRAEYAARTKADRERYEREVGTYVPSDGEYEEERAAPVDARGSAATAAVGGAVVSPRRALAQRPKSKAEIREAAQRVIDRLAGMDESSSSSSEDIPISRIFAERVRAQRRASTTPSKRADRGDHGNGDDAGDAAAGIGNGADSPSSSKRARGDGTVVNAEPVVDGGRPFTSAEDASLRNCYRDMMEREPHELPRLLSIRVDWEGPVTHAQIARRLFSLQLIDERRLRAMAEPPK